MNLRHVPLLLASFAFAACVGSLEGGSEAGGDSTGGGGGGGGGGGDDISADAGLVETVNYEMSVTPALGQIELGTQMNFTVDIDSENFAGPVTIDVVGALDTWDVTYTPAQTVNVVENDVTSVIVTVSVPSNAQYGAGPLTFALSGELGTRADNAQLEVANQVTFAIPAGAGVGDHNMAGTMVVREGTELIWTNNDTITHRIHSSPHGDDFAPGVTYSMIAGLGTEEAYCHSHAAGSGKLLIMVEAAPQD